MVPHAGYRYSGGVAGEVYRRIEIPAHRLAIDCTALNPQSWMGTSFPYWEGPIGCDGTHTGVGYLEMTGY